MIDFAKQPCDEGIARGIPAALPCPERDAPWILAATILGSSMAFVDGTVVNIALPVLQTDLNASVADMQWVVEAYALFLGALLLVGGALGDRLGRRRIFAAGVALFGTASAACGFAPNIEMLIGFRALQGVGGALLVPGSLAIIGASFGSEQRGQAIGLWSAFSALSTGLGLVLGGWLIEVVSWQAIFFINIPVAVIALALTYWRVPESRDEQANGELDWLGATLAVIGLGGLTFGLVESSEQGWRDPQVITGLVIGVAALIGFVLVEHKSRAPMMPLWMFRSRTFSGANLMTLLLYAALSGVMFFLPLNLIQVQGYSTTAAGAAILPFIVLMFSLSRWSGGLVKRYGAKRPLVIGPLIVTGGLALFALPGVGGSYWTTFFPAITVMGLGMALSVAPLTTTVLSAAEAQAKGRTGLASGINNAISRVAAVVAIAALGSVISTAFSASLEDRLAEFDLPPQARTTLEARSVQLGATQPPESLSPTAQSRIEAAIDGAFVYGFRVVVLITAVLALLSAVTAGVLVKPRESGP